MPKMCGRVDHTHRRAPDNQGEVVGGVLLCSICHKEYVVMASGVELLVRKLRLGEMKTLTLIFLWWVNSVVVHDQLDRSVAGEADPSAVV